MSESSVTPEQLAKTFLRANVDKVEELLDTLASLYEAQNNYAEAEPLLKRSLEIRELRESIHSSATGAAGRL